MVSHAGTTFTEGMSYRREHGFLPGVSVFRRQIGRTLRCCAVLPGDCFCNIVALPRFDPGRRRQQPKYKYG
jgi:hypothetical protein